MENGYAVSQAARLPDIGFAEFTTKLVTDVFDALVSANIRQTEAYISLLNQVGNSLTDYINDTSDDIGGNEIMQFLSKVLPPADTDEEDGDATKLKPTTTLTAGEVTTLNDSLVISGDSRNDEVVKNTTVNPEVYNGILDAIAHRIAANKYDILVKMVKQGILRLVVESGLIETRLTFKTHESQFHQAKSKKYNRKNFSFRAKVGTGTFASLWCKASASTSYNSVSVSTAEKIDQDRSGSSVNIFGRVQINFKTDYLPLNE